MKRVLISLSIAMFTLAPAMAQQSSFATPKYDRNPSEAAVGTLANIMTNIQQYQVMVGPEGEELATALNYEAQSWPASNIRGATCFFHARCLSGGFACGLFNSDCRSCWASDGCICANDS